MPGLDVIIDNVLAALYNRLPDIEKQISNIKSGVYTIYTWHLYSFNDKTDLEHFIKITLMAIPEFRMLNVSPALQHQGVTYEKQGAGLLFYSRGIPEKTQDDEFVNLDAAIRNIVLDIINRNEENHDCFLCKYAKRYGSCEPGATHCEYCINNVDNKKIKSYHEPHPYSLIPVGSDEYKLLVKEGKIPNTMGY